MSEGFEEIYSGKANDVIPVMKYKSKQTGMTVVLAQVEGPLVNGYFCLATEAHDDDGLPHTLEHLVFMGSEKYPYKGVLDLLANRCLASGTNAWTDTDHTCYTMTTAGSEGFLNLMPVYLDHVLYPTITESGYITEVHHVNGEGEDAGVVYCEMQGCENTGENRTHLGMLRAMYPGHCGYKSETGGIMKNLRESTSHKKVCDYHKAYYRPENLCLIVTGQVEPQQLLSVLKPFEEKIVSKPRHKGPLPPYERPWQSSIPPLEESVERVVLYPSDDVDHGMVRVAWRGPLAKQQYEIAGIMILMEYLTDTAVAPLQRDFVEIEDPFCSKVGYSIIENQESCMYLTFQNVPKAKLGDIKPRLFTLLENISSKKETLDMGRMASNIHRRVLEVMNNMEDQPHDTVAFLAIGEFLYGNEKKDLETRLNQIDTFQKLGKESQNFWYNLLTQYFIGKNSVTIIGEPSQDLMEEMGTVEKERTEKQTSELAKAGLKEKEDRLLKATKENEVEPPEAMLTSVDVPDVGCIQFHPIRPYNNHSEATATDDKFPLTDIPVRFQLDDIQTNFARMLVMMNTKDVPQELQPYLVLYITAILESAVLRDGKLISYEDVIKELAADTLGNAGGIGVGGHKFSCGSFSQMAVLTLKVEREKYERGVKWLQELLYNIQFSAERLKIIANRLVKDVAQLKRSGRVVVSTVLTNMLYTKESNKRICSMLRQHKFLTGVAEKLDNKEKAQEVVEAMNKLRVILTEPSNITVHLTTHIDGITQVTPKPHLPWVKQLLPENNDTAKDRPSFLNDRTFLCSEGSSHIVGVGSVESSFMTQALFTDLNYSSEDLPAVMVYINYLTQLEGPMWRQIRGLGLSYHYSMTVKPETGVMTFVLFKSSHLVNAYKQGKEIVDGFISGKTPFSNVEFESGKSSLIFEIIEEEKTPADASDESLLSYLRNIEKNYNRKLIAAVPQVTLEDLKRVGEKYIAPLFDTSKTRCAIVCHPTKVQDVKTGFKELGRELEVIENMEESFLAEL